MEMHLEALEAQKVQVAGRPVSLIRGETIHTENSYKYTEARFADLAERGGWIVSRRWISPSPAFGIFELLAA